MDKKASSTPSDPIERYTCFISYAGADEDFATLLHDRLQKEGVKVWFAPQDLKAGQKLHEQIGEAILEQQKLLLILSPTSITRPWVMTELRKARKAERKFSQRKLFPIRLADFKTFTDWECFDADEGIDLAVEVREYFIPDFSDWNDPKSFEAAFKKLLQDLRF